LLRFAARHRGRQLLRLQFADLGADTVLAFRITRFGVGTILKRNVTAAATTLPSLAAKSVSPHTLRTRPLCIYSSLVSSST
jgi:hypothetical protein